jgi:hypothetical protein
MDPRRDPRLRSQNPSDTAAAAATTTAPPQPQLQPSTEPPKPLPFPATGFPPMMFPLGLSSLLAGLSPTIPLGVPHPVPVPPNILPPSTTPPLPEEKPEAKRIKIEKEIPPPIEPPIPEEPKMEFSEPPILPSQMKVSELSKTELKSMNDKAFARILSAEKEALVGGKLELRKSLLVRLAAFFELDEPQLKALKEHILANLQERKELALSWILQEYIGEDSAPKPEGRYEKLLGSFLSSLRKKEYEALFTFFLIEIPELTPAAFQLIKQYSEDPETYFLSFHFLLSFNFWIFFSIEIEIFFPFSFLAL